MLISILFFIIFNSIVSWLFIHYSLKFNFGKLGSNNPQHHHTHDEVTPRIGGIGIVISLLLVYLISFACFGFDTKDNQITENLGVLGGGLGAFFVGFVDDFHPLGARIKLLAQILIGLAAHMAGLSIDKVTVPFTHISVEIGFFGLLLTIGWFVTVMNLINLVDGLDGLAGISSESLKSDIC